MKGPAGFAGFLTQLKVPAPIVFAWLVALLETVGAVLLILGLGTRLLAIAFFIDMVVVIVLVRIGMAKSPFASMQAIGWEFEFALAGIALALVSTGAESMALDPVLGL